MPLKLGWLLLIILQLTATAFAAGPVSARAFVTDPAYPEKYLQPSGLGIERNAKAGTTLAINPLAVFQEIEGFGAAITDSTVITLNALPAAKRQQILRSIFHPAEGMNMNYLRVPIGASDFGTNVYTYLDLPPGQEDPKADKFDFSRAAPTVQMLKEIKAINPGIRLLLSPWSPPAWMKDSGRLEGGSLRPNRFDAYARYLLRSIQAFEAAGLKVDAITVQNEPFYSTEKYPSMRMEVEDQVRFIQDFFYPLLRAAGLPTRIFALDHNYDYRKEADQLSRSLAGKISGLAYHCYGGEFRDMAESPLPVYQTECTSGDWAGDFADSLRFWLDTQVVGAGLIGNRLSLGWNLALDENHGPYVGQCENCRGMIDVNRRNQTVTYNPELIALAHAGKFLKAGARRIGTAKPTDAGYAYIAYRNPDEEIVAVVQNMGSRRRDFLLPKGEGSFRVTVPARGVATVVIQ